MRVNILKKIDTEKLNRTIDDAMCRSKNIFIIMSNETARQLSLECGAGIGLVNGSEFAEYNGHTIAICNKLSFGEVEIR